MKTIKKFAFILFLFSLFGSVFWWSFANNKVPIEAVSQRFSESLNNTKDTIQNQHSVLAKTQLTIPTVDQKINPWSPGFQHQFELTVANRITTGNPSKSAQNTLGIALGSKLALAVIEKNHDKMVIRAELSDIDVSVDASNASEPINTTALETSLGADLIKPYYVTLEPDGRVQSIRLFPEMSSNSASLLRSITAHLQFIQPDRNKHSWQVIEQDQTGEYQAHYQRQEEGVYEKDKQNYQKIATSEGLVETSQIGHYQLASSSKFKFDKNTRLKSFSVAETISASIMDIIQVETQQNMELTLLKTDHVYAQLAKWKNEQAQLTLTTLKLAVITPGKDSYRQHQEKLLGDDTISTLMTEFFTLDLSAANDQAITQIRRRLTALFVVYPETAYQALAEFESELDLEQAAVLAGALASAETPQAQETLSEVALHDELGVDIRNSAVGLLGLSENPTETTIDSLRKLLKSENEELSASAKLALGSTAESIAEQNPEVAKGIVTTLLQDLQNSESDQTLQLSLEALGNSGDPRIIPRVTTALENNSEIIRASGIEALRFVKTPEAVELIANTVTQDVDTHVRQAAIRAMDYQPIEPFLPTLINVARYDEDSKVRSQVVDRTGERLSTLPKGQELLAWVAENDLDPNIRKQAQSYVCDFNPEACQN